MSPEAVHWAHGVWCDNGFRPPRWLRNAHAQTIWAGVFRQPPAVPLQREPLALQDGDELQLFRGPDGEGPVVVILHGLGGCARSPYVLGLLEELARQGYQGLVMQLRGAGEHLNRHPRFFHAGAVEDLQATIEHVHRVLPNRPVAVVGFSMGGIIALNWLGELGAAARVDGAVAVSTPLELAPCADYINTGIRRIYDRHMVRGLRQLVRRKQALQPLPVDSDALRRVRSLRDFDDCVTGPLHGFRDADDYYARCSPIRRVHAIRIPTRIIHALDDPFIPAASLPAAEDLPPAVTLEVSRGGGHVGFVSGSGPARPEYWLDTAVMQRLRHMIGAGPPDDSPAHTRRPPDGGLLDPAG